MSNQVNRGNASTERWFVLRNRWRFESFRIRIDNVFPVTMKVVHIGIKKFVLVKFIKKFFHSFCFMFFMKSERYATPRIKRPSITARFLLILVVERIPSGQQPRPPKSIPSLLAPGVKWKSGTYTGYIVSLLEDARGGSSDETLREVGQSGLGLRLTGSIRLRLVLGECIGVCIGVTPAVAKVCVWHHRRCRVKTQLISVCNYDLKCYFIYCRFHNIKWCLSPGDASGLRGLRLAIPEAVQSGETVRLACNYDLQGAFLYSVKWYREDQEFYRYVPKEAPPTRVFPLPGLHIDVSRQGQVPTVFQVQMLMLHSLWFTNEFLVLYKLQLFRLPGRTNG